MRPDITLVDQKGAITALIDAKWKMLEPHETKLGISQTDLYQLITYANLYGKRRVNLIYPMHSGAQASYKLSINGAWAVEVVVHCLDVSRSLNKVDFEKIVNGKSLKAN